MQKTPEQAVHCSLPTQQEKNIVGNNRLNYSGLDTHAPQCATDAIGLPALANSQKNDVLLTPQKTVRDNSNRCPNVPIIEDSELLIESKNLVCQAMRKRGSFVAALESLDHLIDLNPHAIDAFAMRAIARIQLGNAEGAIADCDTILRYCPTNTFALLHRTSFLKHERGVFHGPTSREKIVQGLMHAKERISDRYATLIKYSAAPLIFPTKNELSEVESIVQARTDDKCAQAVLTAMLFSHWLWTGERHSKNQAVSHAKTMQELWPNDKLAVSVLWYLEGHLGGSSLAKSSLIGLSYGLGDALYRKESIRAGVFFDYPIEQQDIDLMASIETVTFF
jgi:tetratricopeptide (TPR) repeat protein